jgi:hypothetical protein
MGVATTASTVFTDPTIFKRKRGIGCLCLSTPRQHRKNDENEYVALPKIQLNSTQHKYPKLELF